LLKDLQQVTDLKVAYITLDKDIEAHHINSTLDGFDQEKQEAKTPNKILAVISKEQEFLSGLHNNIKYPEHISEEMSDAIEAAYNQKEDNSLKDLKDIANQALDAGVITQEALVANLQQVADLKTGSKKIGIVIENNNITKAINNFDIAIAKASSLNSLVDNLDKKQVYLTSIYGKLKYPEHIDQVVADLLKNTQESKKTNNINKFKELSKSLMNVEHKTENDILNNLKGINNLNTACEKMGGKVEEHLIRENIYVFNSQINSADTAIKTSNILIRKQSYLAGMDKKLEYPNELDSNLAKDIMSAKLDTQENSADKLTKLTSFVVSEKLSSFDDEEVANCLKKSASILNGLTTVMANYHDAYMKDIVYDLKTIEKKGELNIKGKIYDCPITYLTENIARSNQEYAPQEELNKLLDKTTEMQNQKESSRADFER
jgi:hypothetical protein